MRGVACHSDRAQNFLGKSMQLLKQLLNGVATGEAAMQLASSQALYNLSFGNAFVQG